MNTQIRTLHEADAAAYQSIRRRALIEHPDAYGATGYMKIASTNYDILWMSRTLQAREG